MAGEKSVKLHNKSDKPDNIILKEHEIVSKCEEIQEQLPDFLKGFFRYLENKIRIPGRYPLFLSISHRRDGSDGGNGSCRHKKSRV